MTTTIAPKAIYIGVPQVRDVLVKLRPDWIFAPTVPDIAALWEGLENGTIDQQSQIILILDGFFDERGADRSFEKMIASMAPYAFVGIISYQPNMKELINERVEAEAYAMGVGSTPQFYYIDPRKPAPTIDSAIARFIKETSLTDIAAILSGKDIEEKDEEPAVPPPLVLEDDSEEEDNPYLGQVVAVTSSKGGSGKSSVAITLATYLAHASENSVREGLEERPLKVCILDLDVRDGQLGFFTNNIKPTVVSLRTAGISKETIERTTIYSARLKCDLLLAPKKPRNADDTPPEFYAELVQTLRKMYDYVILDTSVNYLDPILEYVAYPLADQIIFVTDIVINSVFGMTRWIQEVTKPKTQMGMGISKNKIGIVVNKSLGNVSMPGEKIYQSALGIPIITAIPSNPKVMASAANTQQMDILLRHSDIYTAIRRLAKAIVGKKYKLSVNVDK